MLFVGIYRQHAPASYLYEEVVNPYLGSRIGQGSKKTLKIHYKSAYLCIIVKRKNVDQHLRMIPVKSDMFVLCVRGVLLIQQTLEALFKVT